MKFKESVLANTLAIVAAAYYLICTLLVFLAPDLYRQFAQSWMHGVDVTTVWNRQPPAIGTVLFGFITFSISAWITGYFIAATYNYLAKKS
ncbi:MAG: hypothetical protein UV73_C0004G0127 [Candidatus Gottesmanbacteria bacterium GW2011_GWA2_43_14]|uniref:Uncharacterized protein n=1 Tax=Candidatus Gottesmanbacteria bacterium GW2011_GWA2_43_14 TaxID=1618443 RepID=A0A0G1DJD8_9BACT|nr:MAG: hypothetical protein UV73_C0004G0127 [Candidatus Gottesmanbacteria bacterium GW2011_GWA2_43_14]